MYVLVKTHKFSTEHLATREDILDICKLRPIVSCCGSPTEKLSWICTTILSPLSTSSQLIYSMLTIISTLFVRCLLINCAAFSSIVQMLCLCIPTLTLIAALPTLLAWRQHIVHLDLRGLTLTEVHLMLELVLSKSFFTYNNKLFLLVGLFMGCMPSPLGAVIRMYNFIRNSIFTDTYYLSSPINLFFGVYMDDLGSLSVSREEACDVLDRISEKDPRKLIKWELDYPESDQHFIPFLSTQIRVDTQGNIHYKFYRKPQKKLITLHSSSHHICSTKVNTAKNFYNTAKVCSYSPEYIEESYQIIDKLLLANGYVEPRNFIQSRSPKRSNSSRKVTGYCVPLSLPHLTETVSSNIMRYINSPDLPIRVKFTSGQKLRDIFCCSDLTIK